MAERIGDGEGHQGDPTHYINAYELKLDYETKLDAGDSALHDGASPSTSRTVP